MSKLHSSLYRDELEKLLHEWMGRKAMVRKDLESQVRKLVHAARVVTPGRTFMRTTCRICRLKSAYT